MAGNIFSGIKRPPCYSANAILFLLSDPEAIETTEEKETEKDEKTETKGKDERNEGQKNGTLQILLSVVILIAIPMEMSWQERQMLQVIRPELELKSNLLLAFGVWGLVILLWEWVQWGRWDL